MTELLQLLSWLPLLLGALLFGVGTLGLLRLPDAYCRLHAVTKADTLGLGLIILGLCLRADHWHPVAVMLTIWVLVLAASATVCQLLARYQQRLDLRSGRD